MKKILILFAILISIFLFKDQLLTIYQESKSNIAEETNFNIERGIVVKKEMKSINSTRIEPTIYLDTGNQFSIRQYAWNEIIIGDKVEIKYKLNTVYDINKIE